MNRSSTLELPEEIAPQAVSGRVAAEKAVLLDVRTPAEFQEVHAVGAVNVPLDRLRAEKIAADYPDETIYLLCKSGGRAAMARRQLNAAGLTRCVVVSGGTSAWEAAGLPVNRGKKVMSLERQVRIAAGSLVVLGVVLSLTVDTWLIGISVLGVFGLVFAGITDTCGMGMLLARMPWNTRGGSTQSCST